MTDIFNRAAEYDFAAIQAYVNEGNDINICDQSGFSLFTVFLTGYYHHDGDLTPVEKEMMESEDAVADEYWDSCLLLRDTMPLEERSSGIAGQLEFFVRHGVDVNLCILINSGWVETPLVVAVTNEDWYMTEFLLKHGADPKIWLYNDEPRLTPYEDWLIDHMDVMLMNSRGEKAENEVRIAALLARYGLDDFHGLCIHVDKETRTVIAHSPQVKF